MRLFITTLLLFLTYYSAQAQAGFIQSYELYEDKGLTFHQILLVEDTLVVCGSTSNPDAPQWGLFFAKLDTLGNILDYKTYYDSAGYNYVFEEGAKMIKTNDGGYALVGSRFESSIPLIFKLDVEGEIVFIGEYPDESTSTKRHVDVIEIENGYISIGRKQQMDDGLSDGFAMGVDQAGNKLWELNYGENGLGDGFWGIRIIASNEILLTGGSGIVTPVYNPIEGAWGKAIAIKIDTLGNILWEWESEQVLTGSGSGPAFGRIYPTADGNWVNEGYSQAIEELFGESTILSKGEIVKRDTNFNVLWSTSFGDYTTFTNNFTDVVATPDGGWVAVGTYGQLVDPVEYTGYRAGMIAKVNAQGDSLWSRLDTLFTPAYGSIPSLANAVVLPSGSIIACGKVDRYEPDPVKSLGWIIKVDRDGCLEPNCRPTSTSELFPDILDFTVFPNPARELLQIKGEGQFAVSIYSLDGKIHLSQEKLFQTATLEVGDLPSGIYFLQIRQGNQLLTKRIVKQ
ncbi:T9SS type A sorting domain-containing protein [Lewinella sp. LCG006]|uniref:T9SS type A sorting domain-containing protein n=1 Tax=Lewinella sp. LCG006 TaxID=3231911 RepID=UPI00346169B4